MKNSFNFGESTVKKLMFLFLAISALALAACGGSEETSEPNVQSETAVETQSGEVQPVEKVRLAADYADALSPQSQLALGTLQLEETDLALDEAVAAELLPLWQALQSLSNSEITADAELNAVVNQIQDAMAVEQIQAIADMKLTEESFTTLLESGELAFGRGGFGRGDGENGGSGFPGGGFPDGFPGGFPGGGLGAGFGGPGGGFGNASEDDIATRQAQFSEGDFAGAIQERVLLGSVIRLMQEKSGEAVEFIGIFNTVFSVVSEETGLTVEEIQDQLASGVILSDIIEANGGDVDTVRSSLVEAFEQLPNRDQLDPEQLADEWLGSE
jgi:hypothetical protein